MNPTIDTQKILLFLQIFHVVHLWIHDWIPLGVLNNTAAVKKEVEIASLIRITLIQGLPVTVGLAGSIIYFGNSFPAWLWICLCATYTVLLVGEFRAWWWPYLIHPDPTRAIRYGRTFANTHAFLPKRHGLVPNTVHVLLHAATLATCITLLYALRR